jgi:hypothetical protein
MAKLFPSKELHFLQVEGLLPLWNLQTEEKGQAEAVITIQLLVFLEEVRKYKFLAFLTEYIPVITIRESEPGVPIDSRTVALFLLTIDMTIVSHRLLVGIAELETNLKPSNMVWYRKLLQDLCCLRLEESIQSRYASLAAHPLFSYLVGSHTSPSSPLLGTKSNGVSKGASS